MIVYQPNRGVSFLLQDVWLSQLDGVDGLKFFVIIEERKSVNLERM
jgi:hypothetical protein